MQTMTQSVAIEAVSLVEACRVRTPARVLTGRAGVAYRTITQLDLRCDHAFARDAVLAEFDPERDLGADLIERYRLVVVQSQANSKAEYLRRPESGRKLGESARTTIAATCPVASDVQIVVGDGLSVAAVSVQVPRLLPLLVDGVNAREWKLGRPIAVRYCRVGIMNDVGDLLRPEVVVLLIGERPGLATAESLSAYLAYRPRAGHTDAERNLISNIHARGVGHAEAVERILDLIEQMRKAGASGVGIKERLVSAQERVALPARAV
jgi:ethanolamine ammonia-lyase small subunit